MQFKAVVLTSILAALAQAVEFTNPTFATITAGQPFTLTWTDATGPVTILLKNGPALALQTVSTIGSGLSGGTFTWSVPATLTADTYALEIRDSNNVPNYSTQFQLIGGVPSVASGSATVSATGSASVTASTGSASVSVTQSATLSTGSSSSTGTASTASTRSITTTTSRASSASSTPTSAPAGGMASGLTSNLALVFLAAGALFMIN